MLVRVCIFVMRMPCEKFSPSLCECMMHDAMIVLHDSHMYDHYPCLRRPLDNLAIFGFAESTPTRQRGTRSVREGCHPQRCVERNYMYRLRSLPASFFVLHGPFVSPASSAGSYPLHITPSYRAYKGHRGKSAVQLRSAHIRAPQNRSELKNPG